MLTETSSGRFAAFRHSSYLRFFLSRFLLTFAVQITSVSVGWQMYDETGNPLYLGLIGLMQFLPSPVLMLVTGTVADRYNRRAIMAICIGVLGLCTAAILGLTLNGTFLPFVVFGILLVFGVARAFMGPAVQSLAPSLVPKEDLANAVAWNSSAWQTATIVGPVTGGLLYGLGPSVPYSVAVLFFVAAAALVSTIPKPVSKGPPKAVGLETVLAGFRFIWSEKIVLGAISLDLFAVLLGGAVALMPVYARDILVLGPLGLGLLRAAPAIGAIGMALFLASVPVKQHAGLFLFLGVAVFGLATIVFGVSQTAWISIAALLFMGAGDMISVYVRETLILLWTPDEVRGRVSAVNMVFVGASNELGEFRAGTMASLFGAVSAVVIGGIGTLAVAGLWSVWFPKLRDIDSLDAPEHVQ